MKLRTGILSALLLLSATIASGADRGYLGISVSVDADGLFNPVVKSVTIENVAPNLPAAKAGLVAGDKIVEIEGHPVAGTKADQLKPYLERQVGQTTRMVVKKANGDIVPVTLVAAPKAKDD